MTDYLGYSYPLRENDRLAELVLPRDLTTTEVERLCAFIKTLVLTSQDSASK